jgi:GNAT superfamily N-acetyltransferase
MLTGAELLAAYDAQLRGRAEHDGGVPAEQDGPLTRIHYAYRGFVGYRSLSGLTDEELDQLIERQIAHFAARGEAFEWKTRGHDWPADLPRRLRAHGFVPEDQETVVIGRAEQMAVEPVLPDGVASREVRADVDLHRIAAMEDAVWGEDKSTAEDLSRRVAAGDTDVIVAEADGEVVSAGWAVYKPGTDFAGLWGGSTLPAWRGRGIYRALVARRAQLAVARGYRYLQVDASDESRPILERLGFVPVTTTTPYVWTPPA